MDPLARRGRWLLLSPLIAVTLILYCADFRRLRHGEPNREPAPLRVGSSSFLVDTPGCRIPCLAPLDETVRHFVYPVDPVYCNETGPGLVEIFGDPIVSNVLRIRRDRAAFYNVSDPARLSCCVKPFWRAPPPPLPIESFSGIDDAVAYAENCTYFADTLSIRHEFVRVECYDDDQLVYKDFFAFTPDKAPLPPVEDIPADVVDPDTPRVSVLMVGVDAVSRSNLLRQMPKTVALMRELNAFDMMGYNKIEDNTFPNLAAVLTGMSVPELTESCWSVTSQPFDACPFMWKRFQALGYRTGFGEEEPWMGIFNYLKNGFVNQPVDYYMRPYSRLLMKEVGHHQESNCLLCTGPRLQLETLLDYTARFARLPGPLFGLFWGVSLTHDLLNLPQLADPLYENFIRRLRDDGVLHRTVLILMSDHGIRWGGIRETYQGRMEERLPFLLISVPPWMRERYPTAMANLRRNTRRLTTPFDLHRTLEDLLDLSRLEQATLRARANMLNSIHHRQRALSLFLVGSDKRTCTDAGIEPHWCTCHTSHAVAVNDTIVLRAANLVVHEVNLLLKPYAQCAQLRLGAVLDARREEGVAEGFSSARQALVRDYTILLQTEPGHARFEATVRHRPETNRTTLAGTVSRVNQYGTQSACVADYHMRLYCYCKSLLTRR